MVTRFLGAPATSSFFVIRSFRGGVNSLGERVISPHEEVASPRGGVTSPGGGLLASGGEGGDGGGWRGAQKPRKLLSRLVSKPLSHVVFSCQP